MRNQEQTAYQRRLANGRLGELVRHARFYSLTRAGDLWIVNYLVPSGMDSESFDSLNEAVTAALEELEVKT